MKRIIATGAVAALAMVGFAGTASAFDAETPQCFGQVHKFINTQGYMGYENVGQLVKDAGGKGKNMAATGLCED